MFGTEIGYLQGLYEVAQEKRRKPKTGTEEMRRNAGGRRLSPESLKALEHIGDSLREVVPTVKQQDDYPFDGLEINVAWDVANLLASLWRDQRHYSYYSENDISETL